MDKEGIVRQDLVENPSDWDPYTKDGSSNKAIELKLRIEQLVKKTQGNYSPNAPMLAKKSTVGRLLMTYKSFMPEGFATRFEARKKDRLLGIEVEGRYRAYKNLGFRNSLDTLHGIFMERFMNKDKLSDKNIDKLDLENMRRNFVEIQWGLLSLTLSLMATAMIEDDDKKEFGIRHAINALNRLQQDITMYNNPTDIMKLLDNPVPALSYLKQVAKLTEVVPKYIYSDSPSHDTDYMLRNVAKTLPVTKPIYSVFFSEYHN